MNGTELAAAQVRQVMDKWRLLPVMGGRGLWLMHVDRAGDFLSNA